MIAISFDKFARGDYPPEEYELYVVRDGDSVRYVGISSSGIGHRWFGGQGWGHMFKTVGGQWYGYSSIGREIVSRMPESMNWTIELWTFDDCTELFREKIKQEGYCIERLTIKTYEPWMIRARKPALNCTHNG